MAEPQRLYGNCHCAAFKFSVSFAHPISQAEFCNCSHCSKIDSHWVAYKPEDLKIEKGENVLKEYRMASKRSAFKFCPTCGSTVLFSGPEFNSINLHALRDVDLNAWEIKQYDSASTLPLYTPHKYEGPEKIPSEGEKVYTGGCHCGNVTVALKTKPLPEVEVRKCNCSICVHNGYMFAYPNKKDVGVHIRNPNNLKVYQFGLKYVEHCFCSECGVAVFLQPVGPPSEELETWSEERKKQLEAMLVLNPLNLHVLDGVEWEELKVTEVQGKDLPPKYVIED